MRTYSVFNKSFHPERIKAHFIKILKVFFHESSQIKKKGASRSGFLRFRPQEPSLGTSEDLRNGPKEVPTDDLEKDLKKNLKGELKKDVRDDLKKELKDTLEDRVKNETEKNLEKSDVKRR